MLHKNIPHFIEQIDAAIVSFIKSTRKELPKSALKELGTDEFMDSFYKDVCRDETYDWSDIAGKASFYCLTKKETMFDRDGKEIVVNPAFTYNSIVYKKRPLDLDWRYAGLTSKRFVHPDLNRAGEVVFALNRIRNYLFELGKLIGDLLVRQYSNYCGEVTCHQNIPLGIFTELLKNDRLILDFTLMTPTLKDDSVKPPTPLEFGEVGFHDADQLYSWAENVLDIFEKDNLKPQIIHEFEQSNHRLNLLIEDRRPIPPSSVAMDLHPESAIRYRHPRHPHYAATDSPADAKVNEPNDSGTRKPSRLKRMANSVKAFARAIKSFFEKICCCDGELTAPSSPLPPPTALKTTDKTELGTIAKLRSPGSPLHQGLSEVKSTRPPSESHTAALPESASSIAANTALPITPAAPAFKLR